MQENKFTDLEHKTNWDNMASGLTVKDVQSAEACKSLCMSDEKCFQAKFDGWECTLGTNSFLMGTAKEPEGDKKYESFWNTTRITKWVQSQAACPEKITFPFEH